MAWKWKYSPQNCKYIGEKFMKILVVGGAGYVGGAVTDILTKNNLVLRYMTIFFRKPIFKEM